MNRIYEVLVHPTQPEPFLVKNAVDSRNALEAVLHFCFTTYPRWFENVPKSDLCKTYNGKFLIEGYPLIAEIQSWN